MCTPWEEFIGKKGGKTNPDFDRSPSGGKGRMDQPGRPSTFDDPLHNNDNVVTFSKGISKI